MLPTRNTSYLSLLKNHIDITRVPFSDRGSRLLLFKDKSLNHLFVKLAERLTSIEPEIEAYLRRPPFIDDLTFIDEEGNTLDFEVMSFPHVVYFHTRLGDFSLVFQDEWTISFGLPAQLVSGIRFHVSPQAWSRSTQGGVFKSVRNVSYQTTGEVVSNLITPREGGYDVEFVVQSEDDTAITIAVHSRGYSGTEMLPFSVASANAELRWREWFSRVPPVADRYSKMYAYAWWVMANNLISPLGNVIYEAMTPSKISYVGLWLWDNAMHSLAYRHIDADMARNQVRTMLPYQLPSGMLPDAIHDEGIISSIDHPIIGEVTKPPILAWAALKLHETDPDLQFLREIYMPMVQLNAWWLNMNDDDGDGIVQYNHPYSSGLDDSPLWDEGMPVESPDINTYLCIQMECLGQMAELMDMPGESKMWRRRSQSMIRRMIEDLWDEDAGLFWAFKDQQPIHVVTPFNLFPLWTGQLPDKIRSRLIAHITNPDEFWGDYVLPTVAKNDPRYDPNTMWRGPIWANVNYFMIEALQKSGEYEIAAELREKTLKLIMKHNNIYEYYNPESGDAPDNAADIFGWTAAVFIDLALQASREEEQGGVETERAPRIN